MKAAVFKGIGTLVLEERPIPACPEDGALMRVAACGICGGDVRNYHNGLKGGVREQIMGHEIAGEVVAVGPRAVGVAAGDRVALAPDVSCGTCWYCKRGLVNLCQRHRMLGTHFPGGYAQYMALPAEVLTRGFVEPIPSEMPWQHAAFAETVAAVLACQERIQLSLGDRVLVIGDGPVGCLHIEAARARGASKVILAGLDRLKLAAPFAPDLLLDNREPAAVGRAVMEATDGLGVDIAICAVPSVSPQSQALALLRKRGTLVIYGGVPADKRDTVLDSNRIHYDEITVIGAFSYPAVGLSNALDAIRTGKIRAERYLHATVSLARVRQGMEMLERGDALKVMIDPWAG